MSNNAHELSNRLLNALDSNYNVVDMQAVNEIISILEKFNITKELLETTRLGKHVNELRRKTADPTLARRAKVLVKRWRDLVIPSVASPGNTGSNRSSAERQVRRIAGTPLTSPALSRQVVSPAVPSPRPPSRPAWGGYESDSQDVILVDDDPPPPPAPPPAPHPALPPHRGARAPPRDLHMMTALKRPPSPEPLSDDKKAKRDKKPKKRRGHSRAGSGAEATTAGAAAGGAGAGAGGAWGARNGSSAHAERRRNGWRRDAADACTALVKRLPPVGAKKVKTTKELLEQIQSRKGGAGSRPPSPRSPASPGSPDVMLIEPDPCPVGGASPLRNGSGGAEPERAPSPPPPLEDARELPDCTCGEDAADEACPAARRLRVAPLHVHVLHNGLVPGVNGTRAPAPPHRFAARRATHPELPGLFATVVPLYRYSDYSDDACVKNLARVPLCPSLPWTEFAPSPPDPPPPPPTPPPRPYPPPAPDEPVEDRLSPPPGDSDPEEEEGGPRLAGDGPAPEPPPGDAFALKPCDHRTVERTKDEPGLTKTEPEWTKMEPEWTMAGPERTEIELEPPKVEPEWTKAEPEWTIAGPELSEIELEPPKVEPEPEWTIAGPVRTEVEPEPPKVEPQRMETEPEPERMETEPEPERTKAEPEPEAAVGGRALLAACAEALRATRYSYELAHEAQPSALSDEPQDEAAVRAALAPGAPEDRDALGRPARPARFAEWHECARLGDLLALPYVVID